jgi:hypothetical protein
MKKTASADFLLGWILDRNAEKVIVTDALIIEKAKLIAAKITSQRPETKVPGFKGGRISGFKQ